MMALNNLNERKGFLVDGKKRWRLDGRDIVAIERLWLG